MRGGIGRVWRGNARARLVRAPLPLGIRWQFPEVPVGFDAAFLIGGLMGVLGIKGSVRASGKPEKLVGSIPRAFTVRFKLKPEYLWHMVKRDSRPMSATRPDLAADFHPT
ncbi:MAG: hypothetical protein MK237_08990, partial [Gemmatimonadetes bacterium]|nr:hypothetical protein [Gemmatimonadota bacterium]